MKQYESKFFKKEIKCWWKKIHVHVNFVKMNGVNYTSFIFPLTGHPGKVPSFHCRSKSSFTFSSSYKTQKIHWIDISYYRNTVPLSTTHFSIQHHLMLRYMYRNVHKIFLTSLMSIRGLTRCRYPSKYSNKNSRYLK